MKIKLCLDFAEFWQHLNADLVAARKNIYLQTFSLEGDAIGDLLANALLSIDVERKILVDSFTRYILSDKFIYRPANYFDSTLQQERQATIALIERLQAAQVEIRYTNPIGLSLRKCLSRNHKKLIIIDDAIAYIGGINFSDHNAAWHDMMFRIDDPAAVAFLQADFLASWQGIDRLASHTSTSDQLQIATVDGRNNEQIFQQIFQLIAQAQESIFVESPYITFPFYQHLRAVTARGVRVQIVTPAQNNWSFFTDYIRWESARSDLDLRLYHRRMSHLKAMLIDEQVLIVGSSNFDYLSYRAHQEIIAIIKNHSVIEDFIARVVRPDLRNSRSLDRADDHWSDLRMKLLGKIFARLSAEK